MVPLAPDCHAILPAVCIIAQLFTLWTAWRYARHWPLLAFLGISAIQTAVSLTRPDQNVCDACETAWWHTVWVPVEILHVAATAWVVWWVVRAETRVLDGLTRFLVRFAAMGCAALSIHSFQGMLAGITPGWYGEFLQVREYWWCGLTVVIISVILFQIIPGDRPSLTLWVIGLWVATRAMLAPRGTTHNADWISAHAACQAIIIVLCAVWTIGIIPSDPAVESRPLRT